MTDGEETTYGGLVTAYPYAFRRSGSWLFRSYVVLGGGVALLIALFFALGLVQLIARTAAVPGGTLTLSRAFYIVVFLFAVFPLVVPVLVVARRFRRQGAVPGGAQVRLALAGYVYLLSLYFGMAVLAPDANEPAATGALAPLVATLNGLPDLAGLALAGAGAVLVAALGWRARS